MGEQVIQDMRGGHDEQVTCVNDLCMDRKASSTGVGKPANPNQ